MSLTSKQHDAAIKVLKAKATKTVHVVQYSNFDGCLNDIKAIRTTLAKADEFVMTRVKKLQKSDDEVQFLREKRGKKVTYILYGWPSNDPRPKKKDIGFHEVERFEITEQQVL